MITKDIRKTTKDIQRKCFDFLQEEGWRAYQLLDDIANEIAEQASWDVYRQLASGISSMEHDENDKLMIFYENGEQYYAEDLTPTEILDIVYELMG